MSLLFLTLMLFCAFGCGILAGMFLGLWCLKKDKRLRPRRDATKTCDPADWWKEDEYR